MRPRQQKDKSITFLLLLLPGRCSRVISTKFESGLSPFSYYIGWERDIIGFYNSAKTEGVMIIASRVSSSKRRGVGVAGRGQFVDALIAAVQQSVLPWTVGNDGDQSDYVTHIKGKEGGGGGGRR